MASVAWSAGFDEATLDLDRDLVESFQIGQPGAAAALVTGRPGAYLLSGSTEMAPGDEKTWMIVADVNQDQGQVVALRRFLRESPDPEGEVTDSARRGTESLVTMMARSDALGTDEAASVETGGRGSGVTPPCDDAHRARGMSPRFTCPVVTPRRQS